jgi:hypothetical protein
MPPTMDIAGTANLLASLRSLRRRVKLLTVAQGAGIVLAAAAGLVLAVVLLDYLLKLPTGARVAVNLLTLGVLGYVLWAYVVRPALARLTLNDLAGRVESTFPQFDDSLRSTVNFMGSDVPGSSAMQRMTVERAARLAGEVDLSKTVAVRPVWTSLGIGLGAVAAFAAVVALADPTLRGIAARRLLAGSDAWPKQVEVELDGGSPARVPAGQEVRLQMHVRKGAVKQATVRHRLDNGPWQQQVVAVGADGTFGVRLPTRLDANRETAKLQVQIEAGDDTLDVPPTIVVPALELKSATATLTPPAYVGGKAAPVPALDRTLDAPVGSSIAFALEFNRPLDAAKGVKIVQAGNPEKKLPEATWAFPRNGVAVATLKFGQDQVASDPVAFTVAATDVDGFVNRSSPALKVLVREDGKPTIAIENPAEKTDDRTAEAFVPLRAVAEDDFGFASVELVIVGNSPNLKQFAKTIPLYAEQPAATAGQPPVAAPAAGVAWEQAADSTARLRRFGVGYKWELNAAAMGVALKPGDRLEYFLRGRDNFALDGKYHEPVESGHQIINVISRDELIARAEARAANARAQVEAIKRTVDVSRATAQEQAQELRDAKKFDDAQRATTARLADQQASSAAQAKQVAKQLQDLAQSLAENRAPEDGVKKAAEQAAKNLDNAADQPLKEAGNKLNEAREGKSDPKAPAAQQKQQADKAAANLDKAADSQEQASKQLEQAMNQLNEFGGLKTAIDNVEKIRAEQKKVADAFKQAGKETLGKKPEDMTSDQKQKLSELTKQQEQLSQDTDKMLQKMAEKADAMAKADPAAAKAMKQAAQTGQQQGIPQKQSNKKDQNGAAEEMQKNQQANAQQKHKEIDIGLETMLEQLKEAERRQLEKLRKDLAEVKKLVDELVYRQANHNVDDLVLQDPTGKKLTELSQADRESLIASAKRDAKQPVTEYKAELAELTPAQEQTHRNAQAAAEKAKALPDATPAGKINAAATKMEQAAVYLRKSQLADAYAPPQVEALKNLLEAKKLIDEAKKKADDEEKEKQQESIRQAYVKLLEEQKKVDADTLRLDKAKDAEGNLKREDAMALGSLPGRQGKLAEQATKLGEKLTALKSVVYTWANKDIVSSMGDVKEDLAKPQTDVVVQAQQTAIEEQLAAMIENLKKKQPKKRFEQRAGGGGGGGKPPPKMPTEAELRLLRDLQLAVNKKTTVIDAEVKKAEGKKDAQKLLKLGVRQGEFRAQLDQLMQQASDGEIKLGDEPDDKIQLPEEAKKEDVEDQEFMKDLLDNKLSNDTIERTVKMVGDRMGRSRQRLAVKNDPGTTTQEIQKRIVIDMENLIELAQQQQQQGGGPPKPGEGEGEQAKKPGEGDGKDGPQQVGQQPGQQTGGTTAAGDSSLNPGGDPQVDISKVLEEKGQEWGAITGRERGPARGAAGEKYSAKYDKYIKDYYKELSKKASEAK